MGECRACHISDIEYKCVPCGCPALCKACAMKMATGGKCKVLVDAPSPGHPQLPGSCLRPEAARQLRACLLPWPGQSSEAAEEAAVHEVQALLRSWPRLDASQQAADSPGGAAQPPTANAGERAGGQQQQAAEGGGGGAGARCPPAVLGLDCEWEPERSPGGTRGSHALGPDQLPAEGGSTRHPSMTTFHDLQTNTKPTISHAERGGLPSGQLLPPALVAVLQDLDVVKAGVGIGVDVQRLYTDFGVLARGCVDVRAVAAKVAPWALRAGGSLSSLAAALLGVVLDKQQQCSHWGAAQLSQAQLRYAATDAWVSRQLLLALWQLHLHQQPSPPTTEAAKGQGAAEEREERGNEGAEGVEGCFNEEAEMGREVEAADTAKSSPPRQSFTPPSSALAAAAVARALPAQAFRAFLAPFLDSRQKPASLAGHAACRSDPEGQGHRRGRQRQSSPSSSMAPGVVGGPAASARPVRCAVRQTQLYDNCRILAPDGQPLCTCSAKKIAWYAARGLGQVVQEDPLTLQLAFEPAGRGHADDSYYIAYTSIVPHCYRRYFPLHYKSHLSHDIVLLCLRCHQECSKCDHQRMVHLGSHYDAPLRDESQRMLQDASRSTVRSAATALLKQGTIPQQRRQQLLQLVANGLGVAPEDVSHACLLQAAQLQPRMVNPTWVSHAEKVAAALRDDATLEGFVRDWRRHFLESMRPRYLPPHWSVHSRVFSTCSERRSAQQPPA
ncbi:hypothetical protein V8C86DRAFT_3033466 [Haematococcus lacustris]